MNEQINETIKPKRYRRVRVPKIEPLTDFEIPSSVDREAYEFAQRILKEEERLHKKIWDGFLTFLKYVIYTISLIFGFIIGIGGCLLEFIWIGIAFLLGWWLLSGIWNWIF